MTETTQNPMGSKERMLQKFLIVVGLGSIIFGVLFFIMTMFATINALGEIQAYIDESATGGEQAFFILTAAQTYGYAMFEGLTLGGICLYLALKLGE